MIFSTEWLACIPTAGLRKVWQSGNWEEAEIPLILLMVFCPQPQDVRLRVHGRAKKRCSRKTKVAPEQPHSLRHTLSFLPVPPY